MSILVENESLCAAYQSGDESALRQLVEQNTKLIATVARSIGYRGKLEFEDLMQEGSIALICAAKNYRPDKGSSFATYAWKVIERKLCRAVSKTGLAIRPPACLYERARRLAAIASEQGISFYSEDREQIDKLFCLFSAYESENGQSLDRPAFDDALDCLRTVNPTTVPLEADLTTDGGFDDDELRSYIDGLMEEALDPGERSLISMRYGLSYAHAFTLAEVGSRLGISRERVRQIEKKSLSKLRLAAGR